MRPPCAWSSPPKRWRRWWSPIKPTLRSAKAVHRPQSLTRLPIFPVRSPNTHQEDFPMTNTHDIMQQSEAITALLSAEEQTQPVASLSEWEARHVSRAALTERISQLGQAVASLQRRAAALPTLAGREHVQWAQALLAFSNLAFLEVDTDGLYADADILRIVLIDQSGTVLYDQVVQPRRPLTPKIAHLTGITPEMLVQAPTLAEVWRSSQLVAAFVGRYILSFNLEFDSGKLAESAARYGLPELPLVGDCLMLRAQEYYGASHYPKLADLC